MKSTLHLILFAVVALTVRAAEPNSNTLGHCPSGHDTLRDVPIVYGLPPFKGPGAVKWQKAVARLEFVGGGCVSGPDSPKIQVTCTTCGFAHSMLSTNMPDTGSWSRRSADPKSFKQPFSPFITLFPMPPPKLRRGTIGYMQEYIDALKLQIENINYTTQEPALDLRDKIADWLKQRGLETSFREKTLTILDGGKRDIRDWDGDGFSIMMHTEHSDRTSWVSAYFHQPQ